MFLPVKWGECCYLTSHRTYKHTDRIHTDRIRNSVTRSNLLFQICSTVKLNHKTFWNWRKYYEGIQFNAETNKLFQHEMSYTVGYIVVPDKSSSSDFVFIRGENIGDSMLSLILCNTTKLTARLTVSSCRKFGAMLADIPDKITSKIIDIRSWKNLCVFLCMPFNNMTRFENEAQCKVLTRRHPNEVEPQASYQIRLQHNPLFLIVFISKALLLKAQNTETFDYEIEMTGGNINCRNTLTN